MPHLRRIILAIVATAVVAFSQVSLDNAFQVKYASNLNVGDSVFNISNSGARGGVGLASGTSASTGGNCAGTPPTCDQPSGNRKYSLSNSRRLPSRSAVPRVKPAPVV